MHKITGATPSDIRPASLVMWESYDYVREKFDQNFFYDKLISEPEFDPQQLRLLWVEGRIAATVMVAKRELYDGSGCRKLGGIGNVAVHPDFRGKGLSVAILSDAVDYMLKHGYDLSTLYTGHQGLYEKVGYERWANRVHVRGRVPGTPSQFERTKDWSRARELFERSMALIAGANRRSEECWRKCVGENWLCNADIVYSRDGSAYVTIVDGEPHSVRIVDAGYADSREELENLLRTELAGMEVGSPSTAASSPVVLAIKSVVTELVEESSCGLMARSISGKPMPSDFYDMDVDRF